MLVMTAEVPLAMWVCVCVCARTRVCMCENPEEKQK